MTLKEKFEEATGRDFERTVSPVIGVILMVAITVILAAVIGAFVMGLGNSVDKEAQAGISFDQNNSAIDVQLTSLGNVDSASNFNVTTTGNCSNPSPSPFGGVGSIVPVTGCDPGDKISVTASIDGKENVVATHRVN